MISFVETLPSVCLTVIKKKQNPQCCSGHYLYHPLLAGRGTDLACIHAGEDDLYKNEDDFLSVSLQDC